jgi:hypothetical protein
MTMAPWSEWYRSHVSGNTGNWQQSVSSQKAAVKKLHDENAQSGSELSGLFMVSMRK